jgi:hypothetical protein
VQHHDDWFSNNLNDVVRVIEVNPITMDAAMADDTDTLTDPTVSRVGEQVDSSNNPGGNDPVQPADTRFNSREQIGRFAPLRPSRANGDGIDNAGSYPATLDTSLYPIGQLGVTGQRYGDYFDAASDRDAWRYQWAKRVAEHFTVQSPEDDTHGQGSAQAFWPTTGGLFPLQAVANSVAGNGATKSAWARVISSSGTQIQVTTIPTWVSAGAHITFYGVDGSPSIGPRNAHYGQRCIVTGVTFQAGNPPTARINYTQGADPAAWDNNDPIPFGTLIRIEGPIEGPGGVEGLININTAPARVLAALPWFPPEVGGGQPWSTGRVTWDAVNKRLLPVGNAVDDNWELAQAIVWWRDRDNGNPRPAGQPPVPGGPFTSIFDLYKVPAFRIAQAEILNTGQPGGIAPLISAPNDPPAPIRDIGLLEGDFTYPQVWPNPSPGAGRESYTDSIRFDFKEQYLLLNRVSNLITTRSDVFTIYVVIQGWRDVGLSGKAPQFVAERRDAIIVDRNAITPNNRKMKEYKVTTE